MPASKLKAMMIASVISMSGSEVYSVHSSVLFLGSGKKENGDNMYVHKPHHTNRDTHTQCSHTVHSHISIVLES